MANPVAVIGLTYRGVDVQEPKFGIFLELVKGLDEVPSVRGENTVVPGRAGRLAGTRVDDALSLVLEGIVTAVPGAVGSSDWFDPFIDPLLVGTAGTPIVNEGVSYRAKARAVRDLFDPKVIGPLEATLEDGTVLTIQARTIPPTLWDHVLPILARVNIQLESVDPDWTLV